MASPVEWLRLRIGELVGAPNWGRFHLQLICGAHDAGPLELVLDGAGSGVIEGGPGGPVRAGIRLAWSDLQRYVAGETILLDLVSTRRLGISGHRTRGLELLYLLKTGQVIGGSPTAWRVLGLDALTPFPSVRVRQDFEVEPPVADRPHSIPIVINSFNRPTPLAALVEALHRRHYRNLYIIDNGSTYESLFDYYRGQNLRVYFLDRNVGAFALWRTPIEQDFVHGFYAYTDSDVVPVEECPDDFMGFFQSLLAQHPAWDKVGFGLKTDDLPDCFAQKQQVVSHEIPFWRHPVGDNVYLAAIDTTFALYRPGARGGTLLRAARTGGRYVARHLPWYANSSQPSPEERYYLESITGYAHWSHREKNLRTSPR
jgi:hypothetical protein